MVRFAAAEVHPGVFDVARRPQVCLAPEASEDCAELAHPERVAAIRVQGAYEKAEPLYARALDIREKALGPMHPDVATSLNNLAILYQARGAYARAEPLLVRALDIREKALGPMHPLVANSLYNLATLYQAQGAYPKAEPLLSRAADIRESQLRSSLAPSRSRASEL
jgi:tetratricopeptide (TPR) repeat protein